MKNTLNHATSMPVLVTSDDDSTSNNSGSESRSFGTGSPTPSMHRAESSIMFSDADNFDTDFETPVAPHVGYKKVLVTGGAGFIGSHVAMFLLERGDDVVIVDEVSETNKAIEHRRCELYNRSTAL